MSNGVIITAIICISLVLIAFINKMGGNKK